MAAGRVERPRGSLVNKLRWPIVASVVVILAIVGYVLIYTSDQAQTQEVFRVQQRTAEGTALSISAYLRSAIDSLSLFAQTQDLLTLERSEQQLAIERLWSQRQDVYDEITLLDRSGNEVAKVSRFHTFLPEELGNQAAMTAFQQALAGEDYLAGEVVISPHSSLPVVEIAVPVRDPDSGDVVGVLMAEASIRQMWDVVAEIEVGETGYAYVVNTAGHLLAHANLARYLELQEEDISHVPAVQRVTAGIVEPEAWEYVGLDGEEVIGTCVPIGGTSWVSVVELPTAEAYASLRRMTASLLGLLVIATLAIGGLTSWLPQRIVRPLAQLEEGAALLSSGRLDHRIVLRTGDELEALGNAFNAMASRLQELYAGLEQQVADRTRDLQRRAVQLEAAAEVAREATAIRDVDELLAETVHLISDRFGFYHAGVFLVDDTREYAILHAASSEGGQRMLERGHRLAVGRVGIVGYVAGTGQPRVALDVGEDAVFFDNPDLPATHSEMALPLRVHGEITGVLDVQSTEPAAFSDEDVATLQTMADQLAVAIENARLFEQTQASLREIRALYRDYSSEAWRTLTRAKHIRGYTYDRLGVSPVAADRPLEVQQALREGRIVAIGGEDEGSKAMLAIPISVRGKVIGVLDIRKPEGTREWTPEEMTWAERVSDQMGLALESARLYQDTQRRATHEQLIGEVTARMRETLDMDTILKTAAQEARRILDLPEVVIRLTARSVDKTG